MAREKFLFNRPVYGGCAIYAIMNRKKMTVYVGQTTNLKNRAKQHDEQLYKGNHVNKELQLSAKQGETLDFITLLRLPTGTSEDELKLLEKLFMFDFLNAGFTLYNETMNDRQVVMQNIVMMLSMHYRTREMVSDAYMDKYNKHYCYDIELLRNGKTEIR